MKKEIFYTLITTLLLVASLEAKELEKKVRITREFTVTRLALDAQEARLRMHKNEDNSSTNLEENFTEKNE